MHLCMYNFFNLCIQIDDFIKSLTKLLKKMLTSVTVVILIIEFARFRANSREFSRFCEFLRILSEFTSRIRAISREKWQMVIASEKNYFSD